MSSAVYQLYELSYRRLYKVFAMINLDTSKTNKEVFHANSTIRDGL